VLDQVVGLFEVERTNRWFRSPKRSPLLPDHFFRTGQRHSREAYGAAGREPSREAERSERWEGREEEPRAWKPFQGFHIDRMGSRPALPRSYWMGGRLPSALRLTALACSPVMVKLTGDGLLSEQ
jgi:hypothetical protein